MARSVCQRARCRAKAAASPPETASALSLPIRQIRPQFHLGSARRDHEADPVVFLHRARPALTIYITPDRWAGRPAPPRLRPVRRKEKKLYAAFRQHHLRDAMAILILKNPQPARPEIGKLNRNVKVLELEFHEKIVAEIDRVGVNRLELRSASGVGGHEHLFRRRRPWEFVQPLDEKENPDAREDQNRQRCSEDRGVAGRLFPTAFRSLDQRG